jgi:hypothetical protein
MDEYTIHPAACVGLPPGGQAAFHGAVSNLSNSREDSFGQTAQKNFGLEKSWIKTGGRLAGSGDFVDRVGWASREWTRRVHASASEEGLTRGTDMCLPENSANGRRSFRDLRFFQHFSQVDFHGCCNRCQRHVVDIIVKGNFQAAADSIHRQKHKADEG